jgi:hypothetical protein
MHAPSERCEHMKRVVDDQRATAVPSVLRRPASRSGRRIVLGRSALVLSAVIALAAPGTSLATGSPSPSSNPLAVVEASEMGLDSPLTIPTLPPPVQSTEREPDAVAQRRGVRLELWVPQGPISSGDWLPVALRVTNARSSPVYHAGRLKSLPCFSPAGSTLSTRDLFAPIDEMSGNAAIVHDELLRALTSSAMMIWTPETAQGCGDIGFSEPFPSGAEFQLDLSTSPRYVFGAQPLPGGDATIVATYPFWLRKDLSNEPIILEAEATVTIEGGPVDYPSPETIIGAALSDPVAEAWIESRDLTGGWNVTVDGPYAAGADSGNPEPDSEARVSNE